MPPDVMREVPRRHGLPAVLIGIVVVAALVRLWGTWYGLPHIYHTDEIFEVKRALKLGAGQFDAGRVMKGGLYLILFLEYAAYFLVLKLTGAARTGFDFLLRFFENPSGFWLIGRATVALLGALNVYLVYLLGRRACGPRAGLICAATLAFAATHVLNSHFIVVDILMLTLLNLALLQILEIHRTGSRRAYVLAGLLAALATITKFPAITILLPIAMVHAARIAREKRPAIHLVLDRGLVTGAAIFAGVMAVANPGFFAAAWNTARNVLGGTTPAWQAAVATDPYPQRASNIWFFYASAMERSLGLPVLLLGLAGVARSLIQRRSWNLALVAFAVLNYVVIAQPAKDVHVYARYALPVELILVLLAAEALDRGFHRFRVHPRLVPLVVVLVIAIPLYRAIVQDVSLSRKDTRTIAKEWIEGNIPAGSKIVVPGRGYEAATGTVPLKNLPSNVTAIMGIFEEREAGRGSGASVAELKGTFRRAAIQALSGKTCYDLILISAETFPQQRLDYYILKGAEYVVVDPEWYAKFLHGINRERFPVVGDFYQDILDSDRLRLLKRFERGSWPGPVLEIYRVEPPGADNGASEHTAQR
jgi:hypothetical protein